jgi:hypothetical protein
MSQTNPLAPDFLIIGAQKAGTTSLFFDLMQHPQILPPEKKEIHYFDLQYQEPISFYRSRFPEYQTGKMTGEASPYYFFHPHVPQRVFQHFPEMKLILLLRDPVHRAFSHFRHNVIMKPERTPQTFEEALFQEERFFVKAYQELLRNPSADISEHNILSYRHRGLYFEQLLRWEKFFSKEQFFIIHSEAYFRNPKPLFDQLLNFLSLPSFSPQVFSYANRNEVESNLLPETQGALTEFFKPHNEALESHLHRRFNWL